MQAVGLVVEYNPFHNGHFHHVQEAKRITGAEVAIAVMSGQFLQRGEPALVDKWTRTNMALANGVDVVIELPYVYSTALAHDFAKGAITLLDAIGCSTFAFGSEQGSITPFLNTVELIESNRAQYNTFIQQAVKTGMSYPQALHYAYESLKLTYPNHYIDLAQPNNILGFHYIEAANALKSKMQAVTIQRIEAGYYDDIDYQKHIASATGIRKALSDGQDVSHFLPKNSYTLLRDWQAKHEKFMSWEVLWPLLKYAILRHTPEQLTAYADVQEGIENALIKHAKTSNTYIEFMMKLKSKRYTWTRLQRMLTHIYTGVTKEQLHAFNTPTYIRLLGMTENGQRYLSTYKKQIQLPLISRVAAVKDAMLTLDIQATAMYAIGMQLFSPQKIDEDIKTPPIRV
ncbi:nucleotidyltransferase [Lysinibacillus sp. KU-BSD001]|uniref:nucleotidyltransferase n=1 Tax=Lysinibacillus sp. KU-BSD001 TaxID=3141328 RepID=UPI0036F09C14